MSTPEKVTLLSSARNGILLRQGGEADVYLLCLDNGERLTLKWHKQPFHTEVVENIQRIKDDGICRIREFGIYEKSPYQLYDYVEGISSDRLMEMPVAVALYAMRQVVSSLQKAFKVGISHGDLNPSNIIFTTKERKDCTELQTVLIDWGITGPGALAYAAPERFQGKAPDEKSDLFSLGMLLFRWIAGENLVEASSFDQFASENSRQETSNVSEKLFLSGKLSPEEISALEPIWDATLSCNMEDRADDFEELDELLEIALSCVGGGDVALSGCLKKYLIELTPMIGKAGQNVSDNLECAGEPQFPFKNFSPKKHGNTLKIAILSAVGIFVLAIALVFALGTKTPNVDDTAKVILDNSRSHLLQNSPTPSKE